MIKELYEIASRLDRIGAEIEATERQAAAEAKSLGHRYASRPERVQQADAFYRMAHAVTGVMHRIAADLDDLADAEEGVDDPATLFESNNGSFTINDPKFLNFLAQYNPDGFQLVIGLLKQEGLEHAPADPALFPVPIELMGQTLHVTKKMWRNVKKSLFYSLMMPQEDYSRNRARALKGFQGLGERGELTFRFLKDGPGAPRRRGLRFDELLGGRQNNNFDPNDANPAYLPLYDVRKMKPLVGFAADRDYPLESLNGVVDEKNLPNLGKHRDILYGQGEGDPSQSFNAIMQHGLIQTDPGLMNSPRRIVRQGPNAFDHQAYLDLLKRFRGEG